jgi:hypothetical protein
MIDHPLKSRGHAKLNAEGSLYWTSVCHNTAFAVVSVAMNGLTSELALKGKGDPIGGMTQCIGPGAGRPLRHPSNGTISDDVETEIQRLGRRIADLFAQPQLQKRVTSDRIKS